MWDYIASQRPDYLIANSQETRRRIQKFYRRDAEVIYPPVTIPDNLPEDKIQGDYYITVSRLARAKHVEIVIEAANKGKKKLKIVGKGKDLNYLKGLAGPTIEFAVDVSDEELKDIYLQAKAYLFASVDDEFGIAPIEAMGYGVPVIAYASGGLKETVVPVENGLLYEELSGDSLLKKLHEFEQMSEAQVKKMRIAARLSAEKYSFEVFKKNVLNFVDKSISIHHARTTRG
ncbi:glycosyltransferase family 4 protein [Candidatus Roizmanbacteria bacterium]|nr:glycosyltransferase family 4 protein [Candidatus Roizmanbacteria bacterium]